MGYAPRFNLLRSALVDLRPGWCLRRRGRLRAGLHRWPALLVLDFEIGFGCFGAALSAIERRCERWILSMSGLALYSF